MCDNDAIKITLDPDGDRMFTYMQSGTHNAACNGLKSKHTSGQTTYTEECDLEWIDNQTYVIKLGKFKEKKVKNVNQDVSFDFQGFCKAIDEAGLEPFIYNNGIAFRRKK